MFWIGFGDIFKEVFERPLQKDNSVRFQRSVVEGLEISLKRFLRWPLRKDISERFQVEALYWLSRPGNHCELSSHQFTMKT